MTGPGPEWGRVLQAAAAAMEQEHRSFSIKCPSTAQRHLISGVTGSYRRASATSLRVQVAELDEYVQEAFGVGLKELIRSELGVEVGAARRRRIERAEGIERLSAEAEGSLLAGFEWFAEWVTLLRANGALAGLAADGGSLRPIIRVLEALPASDEPLPVLSQRLLGDTKALAAGRDRTMLLRALSVWRGIDYPDDTEARRELLEWAGIVSDDIASQVLVLNMPVEGGVVGEWMQSAGGIPFRLTLQQLRRESFSVAASRIRVVENPSILRAAADALGAACPPIVCSEGVPSAALYRLLETAGNARLLWRADFDWTGLRIVQRGVERFPTAEPWRMSAADYQMGAPGIALRGSRIEASWDSELSELMHTAGRAVMEESLLSTLLDDLQNDRPLPR